MTARTTRIDTYRSPMDSICASKKMDSKIRTLSDNQIRGKIIQRVVWDDAALIFELDSGQYLNVSAQRGMIGCSLDDTPIVVAPPRPDDEVLLELDGHTIEWRRFELSQKYLGKPLAKLWFGAGVMFIYAGQATLACHLIVSCAAEEPWLFWTDSE